MRRVVDIVANVAVGFVALGAVVTIPMALGVLCFSWFTSDLVGMWFAGFLVVAAAMIVYGIGSAIRGVK